MLLGPTAIQTQKLLEVVWSTAVNLASKLCSVVKLVCGFVVNHWTVLCLSCPLLYNEDGNSSILEIIGTFLI